MINNCTFFGTFNPIHNGHLNVAKFVLDNFHFNKIIFVPCSNPPHKNSDIISAEHKLQMLKIAISPFENFTIDDIEYKRAKPSYTAVTIEKLIKIYNVKSDEKINFIIGSDAFLKIDTWFNPEYLKEKLHFIVFTRGFDFNEEKLNYLKDLGYQYTMAGKEFEDISSSEIRKKISERKYSDIDIPSEVLKYIKENDLYKR